MTQDLNLQSLRQAAEAARDENGVDAAIAIAYQAFHDEAGPRTILALLDRLERAEAPVPEGYKLVMVPSGPAPDAPDYDEAKRQADIATGIDGPESQWLNVFIREINRWCHHRASRSPAGAAVPDTHVVVPKIPTEAMHVAAVRTIINCTGNDDFPPRVWSAMLAAAPAAPSAPTEQPPLTMSCYGSLEGVEAERARRQAPIDSTSLPELRDYFQESAATGQPLTLSHEAAAALFAAMTTSAEAAPVAQASQQPDERDWKKIAYELAQRVNMAITHGNFGASGMMLDTETHTTRSVKDWMADAMEMMPGVTVRRDLMHMTAAQRRKAFKSRAIAASGNQEDAK